MEHEGSFLRQEEPATGPYSEPVDSRPHPHSTNLMAIVWFPVGPLELFSSSPRKKGCGSPSLPYSG
jgi:hypothetical protein